MFENSIDQRINTIRNTIKSGSDTINSINTILGFLFQVTTLWYQSHSFLADDSVVMSLFLVRVYPRL